MARSLTLNEWYSTITYIQNMLQPYGIKLGLKQLARFDLKSSLKHLILPVNYWRNLEYRVVNEALDAQPTDVILDIGSPKLLALYLSKHVGCRVYATDIESYFIREYERLRAVENISPDRLILQVEDGRNLSFQDEYFDKIFSISVLEHIPEHGDLECAREITRVLKRGGRAVLTVPFARESEMVYTSDKFYWAKSSVKSENGKTFFQRRYSEQDLYDRLINPSGLKLIQKSYFGEHLLRNSKREVSEFLPKISGPIQPMLSKILHTSGVKSADELQKPLCALIVLEK